MLFSRRSSRRRYAEYREKQKDRDWAKVDPREAEGKKPRSKIQRSFLALFGAFWSQLGPRRWLVVLALGTLTVSTGLGLLVPASTKVALDYIITDNPGPTGLPDWARISSERVNLLYALGGVMIGIALLNMLVGTWGRWQVTRLTKQVQATMRRRAFEHAVRLPLQRVYALKSGGMVSILREDAGQAAELLFTMIYNPWRAIVQLTGTLTILAFTDWRMLVGGLALIPATWLTHRTWIGRIRPIYRDIKITRTGIDAHTTESFGGMRVVRGFSRERSESGRFTSANHLMSRQEILVWWWSRALEIIWALLIPGASAAVLVYGGTRVIGGELTIGDVMMFSTYLLMLLSPMETLTNTAASIQNNLAGFDRILDLLAEPEEFGGRRGGVVLNPETVRGQITLRGVGFTYPRAEPAPGSAAKVKDGADAPKPPQPVLRGIDMNVPAGTTVALVGRSGSGKTTLCNLIARFYDVNEGEIRLDGRDLREIDVDSYRRLLGIVEQDVFLFDGTIAENIGYGRRDATVEQIEAAAMAAHAHEFIIATDRGYETLIGERGVRLSGGQKQRIAIARALLADPRILILDEATSNLDAESESLIQASLAELMRGRTCFVIAHRLSTIRNADRIVVLDAGRIVETGTHDDLMAAGGRYSELLRTQVESLRDA
jgi:ATP-binding cassette subfamily B protein